MTSSLLFKIAGAICLVPLPLGHTHMYFDVLVNGLKPVASHPGAVASKVCWNGLNGYFLTTALLCFKWASQGVPPGIERYILSVIIATQTLSALMYLKKGIPGPATLYFPCSLLMGIAALKGA